MKIEKYLRNQVMKSFFTWYERLFIWFRGFFRKEQVTLEKEIGNVWAEHLKRESEEFLEKINNDLSKPYNVKMEFNPKVENVKTK